ncbi:MAG: ABC transporter ATP-binding protein [Rhodobacteraceae bacterium]|nr:ABC transporter ATP-binding protein [Paracoccaceae bacterium]
MIEADNLIYDYARARALDGASLTAPAGEITALVGANGAGKTTLMRILAGLQRPTSGVARVDGIDVAANPRAVHRMVAFAADFIGLYDDLSAERHLVHAGRCAGLSWAAARSRAEQTAERLGIAPLLPRLAEEMSRGQRQRLAIAQALMKDPRLLILDEPASGLDPEARRVLSDLLLALKAEGATILVSSHILSELDDYSDRVAVMKAGRVTRVEALGAEPAAAMEIVTVVFDGPVKGLPQALRDALSSGGDEGAPLAEVLAAGDGAAQIRVSAKPSVKSAALAALVAAKLPVTEFAPRKRRLADAYFEPAASAPPARNNAS